jgi:hypothetical protein
MRKTRATRAIATALTVIIAVLVAEVLFLPAPKQAVSLAPGGNSGSGSALFYVTNAESRAINLARVEVQVRSSGGWKTLSKKTSMILAVHDRTAQTYDWSGKLAAGQYRAVYVDAPTNGPWRVSLTYLRQTGELRTRLANILSSRRVTAWNPARHQVFSPEITQ